jgi:hypothetical protein
VVYTNLYSDAKSESNEKQEHELKKQQPKNKPPEEEPEDDDDDISKMYFSHREPSGRDLSEHESTIVKFRS